MKIPSRLYVHLMTTLVMFFVACGQSQIVQPLTTAQKDVFLSVHDSMGALDQAVTEAVKGEGISKLGILVHRKYMNANRERPRCFKSLPKDTGLYMSGECPVSFQKFSGGGETILFYEELKVVHPEIIEMVDVTFFRYVLTKKNSEQLGDTIKLDLSGGINISSKQQGTITATVSGQVTAHKDSPKTLNGELKISYTFPDFKAELVARLPDQSVFLNGEKLNASDTKRLGLVSMSGM